MKILVTGASGVIGRRVVPHLLEAGHEVSAAVHSKRGGLALEKIGAHSAQVNLFDRRSLQATIDGHDTVINLATHIPSSMLRSLMPGAWRENDRIRKEGSANLVDAALATGVVRFVQESFAPIYTDCGDSWVDEDTPTDPVSYNRTVLDAEASARRFASGGGAGVIMRFAGFYGPDAFQTRAMLQAVRKGWAPMPGSPDAFMSSISHDDAARAVIAALCVPSGTYNVGDDEPLQRRDVAMVFAAALDVGTPRPLPRWLTAISGTVGELMSRSLRMSNRLLSSQSGWKPRYSSIREGLAAALAEM